MRVESGSTFPENVQYSTSSFFGLVCIAGSEGEGVCVQKWYFPQVLKDEKGYAIQEPSFILQRFGPLP